MVAELNLHRATATIAAILPRHLGHLPGAAGGGLERTVCAMFDFWLFNFLTSTCPNVTT